MLWTNDLNVFFLAAYEKVHASPDYVAGDKGQWVKVLNEFIALCNANNADKTKTPVEFSNITSPKQCINHWSLMLSTYKTYLYLESKPNVTIVNGIVNMSDEMWDQQIQLKPKIKTVKGKSFEIFEAMKQLVGTRNAPRSGTGMDMIRICICIYIYI